MPITGEHPTTARTEGEPVHATGRDAVTPFRLDGLVAIVTGASSGLGESGARALGAAGATVVAVARRPEPLDRLVDELGTGAAVAADVTVAEDRRRIVESTVERFGRVDILVNNAGIVEPGDALHEPVAQVRSVLETNLVSAYALTQLVAPGMLDRRRGSIINISSLSWSRSLDGTGLASYAASKGALVSLTREMAAQWGPRNVRVNAIAPAWLPSEMSGPLDSGPLADWISERNALRRPGRRHELDGTILYLAGDASTYVTGQTLVVDGGWSCF